MSDPIPTRRVTITDLAQAFQAWERGVRIHPEKYRTDEEVKCLGVDQVSSERAQYFWELLSTAEQGG